MIHRRSLLPTLLAVLPGVGQARPASTGALPALQAELARIERDSGGRLGVCMLNTGSGATLAHRADERFPMCSTFKLLAAAQVLWRVDRGHETLAHPIAYSRADLVGWSPVTERHLGEGRHSLATLCEAAVTTSDNAAANLILAQQGGPAGLTRFVRSLDDTVTRLDRNEPTLNRWHPGELRDTTTPRAMLHTLRRLVLGTVLTPASRKQLQDWLVANTTGDDRLRAGLPEGWRVGDKTGTGNGGISNDVAVVWPPGRAPLLVTAYLSQCPGDGPARDAVLARVGSVVAQLSAAGPRQVDQSG